MAVKVELFTTDFCRYCAAAKVALTAAVQELGPEQFDLRMLDVVQEIDYAVRIGVRTAPALAVDEKLYSTRPTVKNFKAILRAHL